jgi:hypothetical protein
MKKVTLKTEKILVAYKILSAAKYAKMEDADKLKVFKIVRTMKPIATQFDDDHEQLAKMMKPDDFDEKVMKWNETRERLSMGLKDNLPMDADEYISFTYAIINPYNESVSDKTKEFAEKEIEMEFEPISESAFNKLMNSNDWNFAQTVELADIISE